MLLFLVFFLPLYGLATATVPVKVDSDTLNYVMLGDWGGQPNSPYYTTTEKKIAASMGAKAQEIDSQFTIALGDNFYDYGVKDVDDPRFQTTFENVFTAKSLQKRWYVLCGNHDHYGNQTAEVEYTKKSNRWYMPSLYYTESFVLSASNTTVQMIFIDTVVLAGLTHPTLRYLPPSGPQSSKDSETEWTWIEDTLSKSRADWILVHGHYPVWSVAEHGPTQVLVDHLRPLLMKYNATAYFCGHDHNIQHIKEDGSNVNYFVTGAGHLTDPSTAHENKIPKGSLKFRYGPIDIMESHGSFNTVSISDKTMVVTFFDDDGKQIYTTTITKNT